jgi:8-oxo-dGTP pyrophosphatase MutT (NUDIX family)
VVELNDVYDKNRKKTGRVHRRGATWHFGEYGLVVCVWIYDGKGKLLLTKRAPEKSFGGTWENTGGAVRTGESSRQAIVREVFEETGIRAEETEFELLGETTRRRLHFDHYCLKRTTSVEDVVLQPGETVDANWFTFEQVHNLIRKRKMCKVIAQQFLAFEEVLRAKQEFNS